jgi:arsenate reductase
MADKITVYEKPTCTKCRELGKMLREQGVPFDKVNYYIEPLSSTKLRELISKMGISPRELLRTSEPVYRELKLARSTH